MATSFNVFTSISWITTGVIAAVISSLILSKNPKKILNQLFSAGFIFWSLSLLCNGINFAVAYTSLTAANVFRDLCIIFGILSAITLFLATYGIYFGADSLNWPAITIFGVIAIGLSVVGALNDWVTQDGLGGFKTTDNLLGKACTQIIPFLFIIVGDIFLLLTIKSLKSPRAKRRIIFFTVGVSTVIFGLVLFLIDTFVSPANPLIFPTFGLITWVTGPILILLGFYMKIDVSSSTSPGNELREKELPPKEIQQKNPREPTSTTEEVAVEIPVS